MANVVVEEGQFNRMLQATRGAITEWNARRPAGEAEAIEVYREGSKARGAMGFLGAQTPILAPIAIGALIYAVANSSMLDKIEFLKNHWVLKPLLIIALGYYLYRKNWPYAHAVLAVGAALFVKAWKERPEAAKEAAGPDDEDAGRWEWDRRDSWREREDWRAAERRAQLHSAHRAEHNAERLADRIFEHARAA